MFKFSIIGMIGGLGTIIAFRIDSVMISSMIDNYHTGVYSLILFMSNVIEIPFRSISSISTPIISSFWKQKKIDEIVFLYKKTSLNLLIIGLLIFFIIFINIKDLFQLTSKSKDLEVAGIIFLFLGIAKVLDMTTGINDQIIGQSKHYYFNLIAIVFLAVISIITNYYFITAYGIVGASIGTLISITLYNLLKFTFIWYKFKMQPFNKKHLFAILIITFAGGVAYSVPQIDIILVPIVLKSSIIVGIAVPILYYFKISEDVNTLIDSIISKIRKFVR